MLSGGSRTTRFIPCFVILDRNGACLRSKNGRRWDHYRSQRRLMDPFWQCWEQEEASSATMMASWLFHVALYASRCSSLREHSSPLPEFRGFADHFRSINSSFLRNDGSWNKTERGFEKLTVSNIFKWNNIGFDASHFGAFEDFCRVVSLTLSKENR